MLSCGSLCYHVEAYVIMWKLRLSCRSLCYHVEAYVHEEAHVIMWDKCYDVRPKI
jgi:hypothetical protein